MNESDVTDALIRRYSVNGGNGARYAFASGVRSHAGFDARRTADFMAIDLWPSKRFELQGFEIKVSRSDWKQELKHPEKAGEFIPYVNRWWLVIPELVKPVALREELPEDWGMMVVDGNGLVRVTHQAPRRNALPLSTTRMVALMRAVAQTAAYVARRTAQAEFRELERYRAEKDEEHAW